MKKLILALFCFMLSIGLTACTGSGDTTGSDASGTNSGNNSSVGIVDDNSDMGGTDDTTASDGNGNTSGNNGDNTSDTAEQLQDGTYTAESENYNDEGYKPFVELTVSGGKVSKIDLDAVNENGDYKKDSDQNDWIDQIVLFEQEVVANGIEAIDIATDGTVDGIEGFDLNLGEYKDLINEAIDKAKNKNM